MATDYAGIAKAFRDAREQLRCRSQEYICLALSGPSGHAAKRVIESRLDGWIGLGCWVSDNVLDGNDFPRSDDMRAYRLRWLDALIAEFEGYAKENSTND